MRDEGHKLWLVLNRLETKITTQYRLITRQANLHGRYEMRKQLRFRWTAGVTTTAGHVATSLIPTDTFTQDFINKAIGISAGVYGFDPSYLDRKEFINRPIVIKGGRDENTGRT
jgi:hypothetical protein